MKKIILLAVLALISSGCSRYIESDQLNTQLPDPPPVPIELRMTHIDNGVQVTWQVSDTNAVDYFKIYFGPDSVQAHLNLWDTTSLFVEVLDNLISGKAYSVSISSVAGGLEGARSVLSTTMVGISSISINNGDEYAKSRDVNVTFVIPTSARFVQLSEDANLNGAEWQNYSSSKGFRLSENDGSKTIYAKFYFTDGSLSTSPVHDDITLDTRAEVDSVYFRPSGTVFSSGETISFYVKAGEVGGEATVSFPGLSNLVLYDDGSHGDVTAADGLFSLAYLVPLNVQVAQGLVTGSYQDEAGNVATSDLTASEYLTIANPPTAVTLAAQMVTDNDGNRSISLSWTSSPDNDFETYRLYKDNSSGIQDGDTDLIIWITESKSQTEFSDINPTAGTYHYRVFVFDQQGLATGSNEVTITVP